ncbi:MAG: LPS export ABC transporter periplasmic protein LptC, partial [Gammaproteobacteria bacterium]|nr:LPS export ABC transporter periplasmic protein LptC [Gammaproteobacteria bacterium]
MISTRYILLLIVLTGGALGSWYLVQTNKSRNVEQPPAETAYRGYYLKSARILGTGGDGEPLYQIEADRAEQRADKRIDFTGVRIRYSPEHDIPWVVNADTATLQEESPRIVLRGHVRATSSGGSERDETEIRT